MPAAPRVSVVIPVYNTINYLSECLDSLLGQTYGGWRCILVDDGSTDGSGAVCDEYARRDVRFEVMHCENGGLSAARNRGLERVETPYVIFVDADDVLLPTHMERMLEVMERTGADVADTGFVEADDARIASGTLTESHDGRETVLTGMEAARDILYQRVLEPAVWCKMWRTEVWKDVRFREGSWYEDIDVTLRIYPHVNGVAVSPWHTYIYRQHGSSFLHRMTPRRADVLNVTDRLLACARERYPRLIGAAESRRMSAHFNILGLILTSGADMPEVEARCRKVIMEGRRRALTDRNVRMQNKVAALLTYVGGFGLLDVFLKMKYRR